MNAKCEMRNTKWQAGLGRAASLRAPHSALRTGSSLRNGFTLVELSLALVVLTLVVLLVSGVGASVQDSIRTDQTRAIQRTVLQAVQAYARDADDPTSPQAYPPGAGEPGSSGSLYAALQKHAPARKLLRDLPAETVRQADITTPDGSKLMEILVDAFGRELRYDRTGGLAGQTPVLHSLGADPDDPTDDIETELMDIEIQRQ